MPIQQLQPLIVTVGFLAVFYLMIIKPQKKKEKQIQEMRTNLRVGDEVTTIGGICGKIINVKEDYVTIEVKPNKTRMEMTRWAIGTLVKKNDKPVKEEVEETITEEEN